MDESLTGVSVRLVGDDQRHPAITDVLEVGAGDELLLQGDVASDLLPNGALVTGDWPEV